MLPGVNTESPDATGLTAETSNMRVRGMRSSGGTLSVEGIPNWGGNPIGARDYIYDLQNFNDVSMYKGATPGDIGSGVGTRGGSIVLRPKWPGERFAGSVGLSVGSDRYRRLFARIESGKLNALLKDYLLQNLVIEEGRHMQKATGTGMRLAWTIAPCSPLAACPRQ